MAQEQSNSEEVEIYNRFLRLFILSSARYSGNKPDDTMTRTIGMKCKM